LLLTAIQFTAAALLESDRLEQLLEDKAARAREAWTTFDVPDTTFLEYLADRLPEEGSLRDLEEQRESDLYLACACCQASEEAINAFERTCVRPLDAALLRVRCGPDVVDEVKQRVRSTLLLSKGEDPPRLASYQGRGALTNWVRVTAMRLAFRLLKKQNKDVALEDYHLEDHLQDVETDHLKQHYQAEFRLAFEEAFATLSAKERNLLRMSILEKLDSEALGTMYNVHRTTAARWLSSARDSLSKATKKALRMRLRISQAELESVLRLVRSRIDLSVRRLLADDQ
jgi:RNA polymerase sigma-70 factor (ECF subfamily)